MQLRHILAWSALTLVLLGCQHPHTQAAGATTAPMLQGDPAHPAQTKGWVETRLYFGLGPADQPDEGVSEADWRSFLDREVTTRFPDGLSVVNVYGQWQARSQKSPERLRSKCLVIDYPDSSENRAKVEAIRAAWKRKTGDQSVMRVTAPADVSF